MKNPTILMDRGVLLDLQGGGMNFDFGSVMHDQLVLRRDRVKKAISSAGPEPELSALLREVAAASRCMPPDKLVASCLADVSAFRQSGDTVDDITVMGIRRAG